MQRYPTRCKGILSTGAKVSFFTGAKVSLPIINPIISCKPKPDNRLSRKYEPTFLPIAHVQIMYHLQSRWFDKAPEGANSGMKGPKGPEKPTHDVHSRSSGMRLALPGWHGHLLQDTWWCIARRSALPLPCTLERQSLYESHRQRRWLTHWS